MDDLMFILMKALEDAIEETRRKEKDFQTKVEVMESMADALYKGSLPSEHIDDWIDDYFYGSLPDQNFSR